MIGIIDYGAGNLRSVQKALQHLGAKAEISSTPADLFRANKVILPGVGAFGKAVEAIDRLGLRESIVQIIHSGTPFMGICLGLQLLLERSEESPEAVGLGVLPGSVLRFATNLKVPHLGWNSVHFCRASALWQALSDGSQFYFAHSYYALPDDASVIVGVTEYGNTVPVAFQHNNLFAVQFHPEKSQTVGLQLLKNFINS